MPSPEFANRITRKGPHNYSDTVRRGGLSSPEGRRLWQFLVLFGLPISIWCPRKISQAGSAGSCKRKHISYRKWFLHKTGAITASCTKLFLFSEPVFIENLIFLHAMCFNVDQICLSVRFCVIICYCQQQKNGSLWIRESLIIIILHEMH